MGFVQRRLVKFVVGVVRHPKLTLSICLGVLVASIVLAFTVLDLSTDEDELLTPKLQFFRDFKEFTRQFPENEAFVIILEPKDPKRPPPARRWIDFADRINASLTAMKDIIKRVDSNVPPSAIAPQGLMFETWDGVREESKHAADLARFGRIVGDPSSFESLGISLLSGGNMTQRLMGALGQGEPAETAPLAQEVMTSLANAIQSPRPYSDWIVGGELPSLARADPRSVMDPRMHGYNMVEDASKSGDPVAFEKEKILIISVHAHKRYDSLADVTKPLERMEDAIHEIAADFPEFEMPVITGRAAMQADQMRMSERDTRLAEIMGLSLVFVVLLLFLKNLWLVVAAELCLGVGIGWTFGWATLMVGRLNLLSLVFVIALIGIGMDYLIQILIRYRFEKKRYGRPEAIWARVFRFVSAPISTACAGAAAAFLVAMLTNFHGAAELGLIAGGGLLLCLAAGYTVLPALLTLFPARVGKVPEARRYRHREEHPHAGGWRMVPVVIWMALAAFGLYISWPPNFDPNLIRLQDETLPSVRQVRKLPAWYAVVTSPDLEKLRAARTAILSDGYENTIQRTESILDAYDKRDFLVQTNGNVMRVNWKEPAPPTMGELQGVANMAERLATQWSRLPAPGQEVLDMSSLKSAAANLAAAVRDPSIPAAEKIARAAEWQKRFVREVRNNVEEFAPAPLNIAALPPPLHEHLISDHEEGKPPVYVMYIYPSLDLWEFKNLEIFVKDVEARVNAHKAATGSDVMLTGIAPQVYYSTQEIQRSFLQATFYALIAIFILVLVDMRSISQTLLAIGVLALGLPMLLLCMHIWREWLHEPFGIMGSWNMANFFALPILIGAGHEYGVFLVHRYKESLADPRRVWRPWDVSDRALLLCGIVTTSSFGFLVFAQHPGLKSLGWVMAVGTACTYLSGLLVLRPILIWRLKRKNVYRMHEAEDRKKSNAPSRYKPKPRAG